MLSDDFDTFAAQQDILFDEVSRLELSHSEWLTKVRDLARRAPPLLPLYRAAQGDERADFAEAELTRLEADLDRVTANQGPSEKELLWAFESFIAALKAGV